MSADGDVPLTYDPETVEITIGGRVVHRGARVVLQLPGELVPVELTGGGGDAYAEVLRRVEGETARMLGRGEPVGCPVCGAEARMGCYPGCPL